MLVPSRGFVPGLRVLSPAAFSRTFAPVACLPVLRCLCGFSLSCFFALSCLTSSSQTSFHLSLRPRRASTFFRKESRQRFARGRGSAPFEPPFQRPAANLPFPRAAGRLSGHSAANRRLVGKRPKSQGAKLQLFGRFCAKEDACTLSLISPLFLAAGRLSGLRAANRRLTGKRSKKPKSKAQLFRAFLCVGERLAPRFTYSWKFGAVFCPVGFLPAAGNRS